MAGRAGTAPASAPAHRWRTWPAASGRRTTSAAPCTLRLHTGPAASPPTTPYSGTSALASDSLHLARSTNIDSRFSVCGSRSALQASSTSAGPRCHSTKLASRRPLAEQ